MAKGFNKVVLMGNLTRDPELRSTSSGQQVCSFGLAVNRQWKGADGEQKEAVDFFDCVSWGRQGEVISQYLSKGRPVLVSGRLSTSSWEQDGQKRSKVEITVEDFNFVGGRGDDSGYSGGGYSGSSSSNNDDSGSSQPAKKASSKPAKEVDDSPIDLSDIPF